MAAPLKDRFDVALIGRLAEILAGGIPGFDKQRFLREATADFPELELSPRARAVAQALERRLPADPSTAIALIHSSLPPSDDTAGWESFDSFMMWPLTIYVADHGLGCFEESMAAQHALTQLFTAEFSVRPFLVHHPERTLARLREWTGDPSDHVRRLVSEGTRPRLPWAPRLCAFVRDPGPVLPLLELLRDDPSEYVRRSVANNLNDISKDHPGATLEVTGRWLAEDPSRRPMVRHALRTLVKAGDPAALAVLGYDADSPITAELAVSPSTAHIGDTLVVTVQVENPTDTSAEALVDLVVTFPRPSGSSRRVVFAGTELQLEPGRSRTLRRSVTLAQLSTRTVFPGPHSVAVMLNGVEGPATTVPVAS